MPYIFCFSPLVLGRKIVYNLFKKLFLRDVSKQKCKWACGSYRSWMNFLKKLNPFKSLNFNVIVTELKYEVLYRPKTSKNNSDKKHITHFIDFLVVFISNAQKIKLHLRLAHYLFILNLLFRVKIVLKGKK